CATSPAPRTSPAAGAAAPAPAASTPASQVETGPFPQLMAREASGLRAWTLQFPGGPLSGAVEAATPPSVQREGESWTVTIPIGSAIPVSCVVFPKAVDGAGTLLRFIRTAREGAKGITVRSIVPTDVGVVDETAYMF